MKHPFDISRRRLLAAFAGALVLQAGRALGEDHEGPTTLAVGEEGGKRPELPPITTEAEGEEGGRRPVDPPVSTDALGEEGGGNDYTTQAEGEEGGGRKTRFDAGCFEDSAEIVMALVENPKTSRKLLRDGAKIIGATKSYEGRGVTIYTIETKLPRGRKRTLTLKKTERDGNVNYSDAKFEET